MHISIFLSLLTYLFFVGNTMLYGIMTAAVKPRENGFYIIYLFPERGARILTI